MSLYTRVVFLRGSFDLYRSNASFFTRELDPLMEEQEDVNSVTRIFRPSDSREFAASRFRDAYEFKEEGFCRYMFLHPADAHSMKEGTCAYDVEKKAIRIFSDDGNFLKEFTVRQLSQDMLVIEPRE